MLDKTKSVKPNYDVEKDRRYLDVLCFPEGKVILHGYYDYNYSFCYYGVDNCGDTDLSDLIIKIIFGEWEHYYPFIELKRAADEYSSYRLNYFCNESKITQYSSSIVFEPLCVLDNNETVGRVIDSAIKDIYEEKAEYDEDQVIARLTDMKKMIAESEDLLFEKKILPIERELSRMQHLIFGSGQIRTLYKECRELAAKKYDAYMTLVK